ncbi:MAG: histidine phosphatase family protein [Rhodocyclaceae bacterium]|nr:histidine phosphatase family protein [Rhodocyclaceae bacterium]
MKTTKICLLRHGETNWNAQKRVQGQIDVGLNANGRTQAALAARRLAAEGFDRIYSSDLRRCMETAEPIATRLAKPVTPCPGIRERHYGCLQGLTAEQVASHMPEIHARYRRRDPDFDFAGGESLSGFAARVIGAVEMLVAAHTGEKLLLVTHGGVLDVIYREATGRDLSSPRDFPIPNARINWLEFGRGRWRVVSWDDGRHREQALEEVLP